MEEGWFKDFGLITLNRPDLNCNNGGRKVFIMIYQVYRFLVGYDFDCACVNDSLRTNFPRFYQFILHIVDTLAFFAFTFLFVNTKLHPTRF